MTHDDYKPLVLFDIRDSNKRRSIALDRERKQRTQADHREDEVDL